MSLGSIQGYGDYQDYGEPYPVDYSEIPGEPGKDYPVYQKITETNFSCEGKETGGN